MIQFLPPPSKNLKSNNKSEGCFVFLPSEGKARGAEERGSGSRRFPPRMLSAALGLPIALFPRKKWDKKEVSTRVTPTTATAEPAGACRGEQRSGIPVPCHRDQAWQGGPSERDTPQVTLWGQLQERAACTHLLLFAGSLRASAVLGVGRSSGDPTLG